MQHIAYRHFNIIFKNFFEGGAQNLTLPPGASYPRYATAMNIHFAGFSSKKFI